MNNIAFNFSGKVALITGAASGIGSNISNAFAKSGAKVVVADLNEDLGLRVVDQNKKLGAESIFVKCDVSNEDDVKNLIDQTIEKFSKIDIVCNDAGVEGVLGSTVECTTSNWDKTININLKGLWLCMKYQIPQLILNGGGSIVNISSIAGLIGFPGFLLMLPASMALLGLLKLLP